MASSAKGKNRHPGPCCCPQPPVALPPSITRNELWRTERRNGGNARFPWGRQSLTYNPIPNLWANQPMHLNLNLAEGLRKLCLSAVLAHRTPDSSGCSTLGALPNLWNSFFPLKCWRAQQHVENLRDTAPKHQRARYRCAISPSSSKEELN